ncbi:uncharacterized protein VP01_944g9, partial [Puccinia sorghi]
MSNKKPAIRRKFKKNKGNNSSEDDAADKTAGHLKKEDYLVIIKWLKIKRNYRTGKAPPVGHPSKGKINGFEMCYDLVNPYGTCHRFPQLGDYIEPPHLYDGYQSPQSIPLKDQPNPPSDEGLIQYLQRQVQE